MKMPFGKHKGTPIEEIPNDYLRWLDSIELADWCFKWDLAKKDEVRIAVTEEVARRRALEESQLKASITTRRAKPVSFFFCNKSLKRTRLQRNPELDAEVRRFVCQRIDTDEDLKRLMLSDYDREHDWGPVTGWQAYTKGILDESYKRIVGVRAMMRADDVQRGVIERVEGYACLECYRGKPKRFAKEPKIYGSDITFNDFIRETARLGRDQFPSPPYFQDTVCCQCDKLIVEGFALAYDGVEDLGLLRIKRTVTSHRKPTDRGGVG
jgi:hypothetical protein